MFELQREVIVRAWNRGKGGLVYLNRLSQKAVRQCGAQVGNARDGRFRRGGVHRDNGTEVSWRPGVFLRGVGRECVGEQWKKWKVELLRLSSSWAMWRLSCEALRGGSPCLFFLFRRWLFGPCEASSSEAWSSEAWSFEAWPCEAWSLARRGAFRGMVLRDLEV